MLVAEAKLEAAEDDLGALVLRWRSGADVEEHKRGEWFVAAAMRDCADEVERLLGDSN